MATRIVVDPVTRIEGHLRIEAEVKDGKIVDAYSAGTMVRGFEKILPGRDPRDAWAFAERACGVCTTVHALASVRTVENALGITVPPNAEMVRNLMFLHSIPAGPCGPFLPFARSRLGRCGQFAQGRSGEDLGDCPQHFELAKDLAQIFRRRSGSAGEVCRERAVGHFCQCLLGPQSVQAAAGSEPPGRGPLS